MATISDYLTSLQNDLATAKTNLANLGVEVLETDTFTEISEKMASIETGGGDISEYYDLNISNGTSSKPGYIKTIKKIPSFIFSGENASYMFKGYEGDKINLTNFNTSNTKDMRYMFDGISNVTNLDLSNFNTSQVTNMSYMFNGENNIENLNLSNFDMSLVTNTSNMFRNNSNLKILIFGGNETNNLITTAGMLNGCSSLNHLDMRNYYFNNITNHDMMFNGVPTDCLIIVKDETAKSWITSKFANLTNVKTVAELENE